MAFPSSPRYFLRFRHSDVGLTPTFTFFKKSSDLSSLTPPSIHEIGFGTYYYDWTWNSNNDPDIVFEVDGGASIPTEDVRYISGVISPRENFLDVPNSQIVDDVWNDTTNRASGTKGALLQDVSTSMDSVINTLGNLPAGQTLASLITNVPENVWKITRAAHTSTGDFGETLNILYYINKCHIKINKDTKQLEVYNDNDEIVFRFYLYDLEGLPTDTAPTERVPVQ